MRSIATDDAVAMFIPPHQQQQNCLSVKTKTSFLFYTIIKLQAVTSRAIACIGRYIIVEGLDHTQAEIIEESMISIM